MPIDDLTALGQKMREARKKKDLTQQELADLSHVSVKQIANIEKGKMNPKTVQYLAGHENSKTTMDIYAKVKYNKPEELFDVVNQALRPSDLAENVCD